jgi:thioredoxin reductase/ferredoxin
MNHDLLTLLIYATPLVAIWWIYVRNRAAHHRESTDVLADNLQAGLTSSASLHPVIDHTLCIGCGSCLTACPEMPGHQVLGLVRRKATLISPTDCIGHGACRTACPVDAISLVFGTAERGVDIPHVSPDFQSNVDGIYIAGELGGMGLIRNAIEQGKQAVESIAKRGRKPPAGGYQLVIVGAGPSGISAALAAKAANLKYIAIEQDSLGGTVANFPKRKLVMTAPATLPIVGKMKFTETTKETLMRFWQQVAERTQLNIVCGERVVKVQHSRNLIEVETTQGRYTTTALLLAIGRRGTPRHLGVPGEELPKVTYKLVDPEQYRGQSVLVVGGGDSAIESALAVSAEPGTTVTLSYRSASFSRAKKKNRDKLEAAVDEGRIQLLLESNVTAIDADFVELEQNGRTIRLPNDACIVNAGGILPTSFLKEIGIAVETKYGTA